MGFEETVLVDRGQLFIDREQSAETVNIELL
jgi:hypothetical protein